MVTALAFGRLPINPQGVAEPSDQVTDDGQATRDSFGVLVGWTHREFNGRLGLNLQTIESTRVAQADAVDTHHFLLTKSQAAVLANFLLKISGQTPPRARRRGVLSRWLGL